LWCGRVGCSEEVPAQELPHEGQHISRVAPYDLSESYATPIHLQTSRPI
jgi:hypothetical protein